jgi:signal peptidase I
MSMDSDETKQPAVEAPTSADEDPSAAADRWRAIEDQRAKAQQNKPRPFWVELPILLVIAFVMTFLIQTFLFKVYYIPSGSMEKTLHGVSEGGDRVLVNKVVYDFTDADPGEVVVFSGPTTWAVEASIPGPSTWYGKFFQAVGSVVGIAPPNEKDFVKRVIATAGQTVQCCDAQGHVEVNGAALDEAYIFEDFEFTPGTNDCTSAIRSQRCFGPVTVPAASLWVMGDHRSDSKDSAYGCRGNASADSCQGPIPADNVIGHAIFIVMPVSRWQPVHSPDIQAAGSGSALPLTGGLVATVLLRGGYGFGSNRLRRNRSRHRWRGSRWQHR